MKARLIDKLRIASPCPASWGDMEGDNRVRSCAACKLNVYNLSGMTGEEAEELLGSKEGRVCVRIFRRLDGTVLTSDCPVGSKRRRSVSRAIAALFAASALFWGYWTIVSWREVDVVITQIVNKLFPGQPPPPIPDPQPLMGKPRPEMGEVYIPPEK